MTTVGNWMMVERAVKEAADSGATRLDLSSRTLTELPPELFQLTNIKELKLTWNNLTAIPREIGMLTQLEKLHIDHNQLRFLPIEIGDLTQLLLLDCGGNRLLEVPPRIGQLINLEVLALNDNQLSGLPPEIGRLAALREAMLQDNQLKALPSEIGNLARLELLDASNNQLSSLPHQIGNLAMVSTLTLRDNGLATLPGEIGNLAKLASLDLERNMLARLPSEIGRLAHLKWLNLNDNQLTTLPSEIGGLRKIEWMNIANNQLTALPREFGDLASLESLSLFNNEFTKLPDESTKLEKLKCLEMREGEKISMPLASRAKEWDVFISHSSDDKESVALPLARALMSAGLKVWIDQHEIKIGDSIRSKIDLGLAKSTFGIVILSESFLNRVWTQRELNGLLAIEEAGGKVVLPVWHNISKATLSRYSPILADRSAADTKDGIPAVAAKIVDVVISFGSSTVFPSLTGRLIRWLRWKDATGKDLRDFLLQHSRVIRNALAYRGAILTDLRPTRVGGEQALFADFQSEATIKETRSALLIFGSPKTSWLREGLSATELGESKLDSMRSLIRQQVVGYDEAIIVAGRRNELEEIDRELIATFNQAVEKDSKAISLRTYDWFVDACLW